MQRPQEKLWTKSARYWRNRQQRESVAAQVQGSEKLRRTCGFTQNLYQPEVSSLEPWAVSIKVGLSTRRQGS